MTEDLLQRARQRHTLTARTLAALIAALTAALAVAAATVSIGIARADVLGASGHGSGRLTFAALAAVAIAGVGGLTAIMVKDGGASPRRE